MARVVLLLQVGPRVGIVGDQVGTFLSVYITIPMPDVGIIELKIRSLDHLLVAYSDTHPATILLNLERKYATLKKCYTFYHPSEFGAHKSQTSTHSIQNSSTPPQNFTVRARCWLPSELD